VFFLDCWLRLKVLPAKMWEIYKDCYWSSSIDIPAVILVGGSLCFSWKEVEYFFLEFTFTELLFNHLHQTGTKWNKTWLDFNRKWTLYRRAYSKIIWFRFFFCIILVAKCQRPLSDNFIASSYYQLLPVHSIVQPV